MLKKIKQALLYITLIQRLTYLKSTLRLQPKLISLLYIKSDFAKLHGIYNDVQKLIILTYVVTLFFYV